MLNRTWLIASYSVALVTDLYMIILDNDDGTGASITNAAASTIEILSTQFDLRTKRVIYRDSMGRYDELVHGDNRFIQYKPLSADQQVFFKKLCE
jgi:hypothetical protein